MSTPESDAIRAVEIAIRVCEGGLTVDGIRYDTYHDADIARRTIAVKAVAQSTLLRRWVAIRPPCPWCGESITADDTYVEIAGIRVHSTNGRPCAEDYTDRGMECYASPCDNRLHLVRDS
jgi:hypothetical protein